MNDDEEDLEKESHRQQMLGYLKRDVDDAKLNPHITIGFNVWARNDDCWAPGQCPRAVQLEGVYLPAELPDLYPADCPSEEFCCCILYEAVLSIDDSPESRLLREKIAACGLPAPPPPWEPMEPLTPEAQAETLALIEKELNAVPAQEKGVWRYLQGLFSKQRT